MYHEEADTIDTIHEFNANVFKWTGHTDAEGAEEIAEEVFYDCRERQKRRNKQKVPPKTKVTCHRHLRYGAKTRKCAAPDTCKMATARQNRATNLRDKVALTTETDEADDYDEDHEFEVNAASWIESADDNLTEVEEIFYDCADVEEIGSVSCD